MKHSIDCPYPEGCNCGASPINRLLRETTSQKQELATLRAKAVFTSFGTRIAIADSEWQAKRKEETHSGCGWSDAEMMGCICRKVKIVEVVE